MQDSNIENGREYKGKRNASYRIAEERMEKVWPKILQSIHDDKSVDALRKVVDLLMKDHSRCTKEWLNRAVFRFIALSIELKDSDRLNQAYLSGRFPDEDIPNQVEEYFKKRLKP